MKTSLRGLIHPPIPGESAVRGRKCFSLIVEDYLTFRNSLKEMLAVRFPPWESRRLGGDEALHIIEKAEPDLVLWI